MTKIQTYCYSALCLLAVFCLSTTVSLAQRTTESSSTTIDPFAVLPAADALIVVDFKRFSSEVLPRILAGEHEARALAIALPNQEPTELLDRILIQRAVIGFRYTKPQDEKSSSDFEVVTVAQSSEAIQLPALIRSTGSGKYREQRYAGTLIFIRQSEQTEPKEATTPTSSDESEWAIVALDANTVVFGHPAYVRASIDVRTGKGTTVSAELVADVKRNPKALLTAAGQLPPALKSAGQQLGNSDLSQMLSSLKRFYASIELIQTGFDVAVTLNTTSPEQTRSLVDLLTAIKTLGVKFVPGKTRQEKLIRDLIKGLVISGKETEVQIKEEITQTTVNEIAKQYAAAIYFDRGAAQLDKGDSEAAIAEYNKAILLVPDDALTFINRGKALSDKGDLDEAIANYDKAIALDPDNGLAYNNLCFVRVKKENFDAAIADCDKAIALDPSDAYAYNNRGRAFASQGKLDKAISDYDKSIAFDPENPFAFENRGDARIEIGNYDGAITDYDKAISIDANSVGAYNGRGLARFYKGEFDQAIADYDKALALDPKGAITYYNRALALVGKGNLDKAMADYDKSIALNDKNDLVYINRGHLRNHKGDWNGAIADFDKAIALNPKSAEAYNGRGVTRYSKEEFDLAIADFDRAIAIEPSAATYLNRGYARQQKSDLDGAIADFDKLISLEPKLAEAYNARGVAHFYNGNIDQAIADYDKVFAIEPNFAEAYGNRALALLALGRDAQADKDLNKCFALDESLRREFDPLVKEVKKTRRTKSRKHH